LVLSSIYITVNDDPEKDKKFKEDLKNKDDNYQPSLKANEDQDGKSLVTQEKKEEPKVEQTPGEYVLYPI
jgi:hypothetical protein